MDAGHLPSLPPRAPAAQCRCSLTMHMSFGHSQPCTVGTRVKVSALDRRCGAGTARGRTDAGDQAVALAALGVRAVFWVQVLVLVGLVLVAEVRAELQQGPGGEGELPARVNRQPACEGVIGSAMGTNAAALSAVRGENLVLTFVDERLNEGLCLLI